MRILYDGQIYNMQLVGGVRRYISNLISRLPANFSPTLIAQNPPEVGGPRHPRLKSYYCGRTPFEKISWRFGKFVSDLETRRSVTLSLSPSFDVAHPSYYKLITGRAIKEYRCPVVITVHDMIHDLFPQLTVNAECEIDQKRRAVEAAQAIICVSENTKKDLVNMYGVSEEKITVVHLASSVTAALADASHPVPVNPYFLYVGDRSAYKNFSGLLLAFCKAFQNRSDFKLCVAGSPFNNSEIRKIDELGLTDRLEHHGYVSDSLLATLYQQSVAFVYPSLYEGFGLPPLEAMSCGAPVIASNCSSIPEVVGNAGVLFNPLSLDALADAMLYLADNPEQRRRLIELGLKRAQTFGWDQVIDRTLNVYRSVSN